MMIVLWTESVWASEHFFVVRIGQYGWPPT